MAIVEPVGIKNGQASCRVREFKSTKGWGVDNEALEMYQKTLTDKILADVTGMVEDNVDLSKFQEEIVSAAASVERSTAASRHKIEREEPVVIIRLRSQLGETSGEERRKICHMLNNERRTWFRQKAESTAARAKVSYESKTVKTIIINGAETDNRSEWTSKAHRHGCVKYRDAENDEKLQQERLDELQSLG